MLPLAWSLDHLGPLTRSVADAALLLEALAGYDARDRRTRQGVRPPTPPDLDAGARGLRIGVLGDDGSGGRLGSDAALETADVALMADELSKIPYTLRLSRATARNIHGNIAFSIVLKGAFLILAVTGAATLWMAVAADMGASLIVIANALRLLRE